MAGLIGFTRNNNSLEDDQEILCLMQNLITHNDNIINDSIFIDDFFCGTRSHTNIIQKQKQPLQLNGIIIWIDGEFYNQEEIKKNFNIPGDSDPELLVHLYQNFPNFAFLKHIDGIFSAVLYDSCKKKIHLISDRYGFRYLYWIIFSDSLFWGSELKAMLAIPDYIPRINDQSVDQFFSLGYLLENNTWFEDVSLLPSGSVLTWDLSEKLCTIQRYWWWDEIKPIECVINEDEIAEKIGDLFVQAVQRRCYKNERIGLTLSGGLDSRAILAAIPEYVHPLNAITFGKMGCKDAKFAKMAADVKGAEHNFFELDSNNWLLPRFKGVWWTDGQLDLMHMHGIEFSNFIKKYMDVNLNGFFGDVVLGGSFLNKIDKKYFDNPIDNSLFKKLYGNIDRNLTPYSYLNKTDFFYIQNRARRFALGGIKYSKWSIEQRIPFFDNKLIEFIYSIPDKYRYNHSIYNKMLLKKFPHFFETIPWQKKGYPISYKGLRQKILDFENKLILLFIHLFQKFKIRIITNKEFTNYPEWIRNDPAKTIFLKILSDKNALYPKYLSKEIVMKEWEEHINGKDYSENLCRYLTFEIWLQQVYNKKYRDGFL